MEGKIPLIRDFDDFEVAVQHVLQQDALESIFAYACSDVGMAKGIFYQPHLVFQLSAFLGSVKPGNSLSYSIQLFCSALYVGLPLKTTQKLQLVKMQQS